MSTATNLVLDYIQRLELRAWAMSGKVVAAETFGERGHAALRALGVQAFPSTGPSPVGASRAWVMVRLDHPTWGRDLRAWVYGGTSMYAGVLVLAARLSDDPELTALAALLLVEGVVMDGDVNPLDLPRSPGT